MSDKVSNLLLGYNASSLYVVAVSDGHVVFVNNAAAEIAGENYVGRTAAEMLGEQTALLAVSGRSTKASVAEFFDRVCRLEVYAGDPTLFVFSHAAQDDSRLLDAICAFAAGLRNPFSEILVSSEGLRRLLERNGNDKVDRYLSYLDHSGHQLLHMLERVSMVHELSMPEEDMRVRLGNLTALCRSVAANTAEAVKPLGIPLVFEESPEIFTNFDAQKVERALLCLLSNSLRFTREGNTVTVSVTETDKFCYIKVADNGAGISPEWQSLLGEVLRSERREAGRGVGLGLRIVRQIAALHSGSIIFESQLGSGTIVTFSLAKDCSANVVSNNMTVYNAAQIYLTELSPLLDAAGFARLRTLSRGGDFPKKD